MGLGLRADHPKSKLTVVRMSGVDNLRLSSARGGAVALWRHYMGPPRPSHLSAPHAQWHFKGHMDLQVRKVSEETAEKKTCAELLLGRDRGTRWFSPAWRIISKTKLQLTQSGKRSVEHFHFQTGPCFHCHWSTSSQLLIGKHLLLMVTFSKGIKDGTVCIWLLLRSLNCADNMNFHSRH